MSDRGWATANAAKIGVGVLLSIVVGTIIDVMSRRWPAP